MRHSITRAGRSYIPPVRQSRRVEKPNELLLSVVRRAVWSILRAADRLPSPAGPAGSASVAKHTRRTSVSIGAGARCDRPRRAFWHGRAKHDDRDRRRHLILRGILDEPYALFGIGCSILHRHGRLETDQGVRVARAAAGGLFPARRKPGRMSAEPVFLHAVTRVTACDGCGRRDGADRTQFA